MKPITSLVLLTILKCSVSSLQSNNTLYIRSYGCDIGICSVNDIDYAESCAPTNTSNDYQGTIPLSTCASMGYAYKCLLGDYNGAPYASICHDANYSGFGVIDIGEGTFNLSFPIHLNNTQITIRGKGPLLTTLDYISNNTQGPWYGCTGTNSYLKIANLSIASTTLTDTSESSQLLALNEATLEFDNVLFDGHNYAQPADVNIKFWKFTSNSTAIFRNCVFRNNDVQYLFDGAVATFINCIFENNIIRRHGSYNDRFFGMFYVQNAATILFQNCMFNANEIIQRTMFSVVSGMLLISDTKFVNNYDSFTDHMTAMSIIWLDANSPIKLNITNSVFDNNSNHNAFVRVFTPTSTTHINIDNTVFVNNNDISRELEIYGRPDGLSFLKISNSQFENNSCQTGLYIDDASLLVTNTSWNGYQLVCHALDWCPWSGLIEYSTSENLQLSVILDHIQLLNINGPAISIKKEAFNSESFLFAISNSYFFNIDNVGGSCIDIYRLQPMDKYIIRNVTFEQCFSKYMAGALYLGGFNNDSVIENIRFINNYAEVGAADMYLWMWTSDSPLILKNKIKGIHISGSSSKHSPSSVLIENPIWWSYWMISFDEWIIEHTKCNAAVYLKGNIAFEFNRLTAFNNEKEVITALCGYGERCIGTVSVINSVFFQNYYGAIISYSGLSESQLLVIRNTTFADNNGVLVITAETDTSIVIIENSIPTHQHMPIQSVKIDNISDSVNGWWFECNFTQCRTETFTLDIFQTNELLVSAEKSNVTLRNTENNGIFTYDNKSLALQNWSFTSEDSAFFRFNFIFEGNVVFSFKNCEFMNLTVSDLFYVSNSAEVIFDDCQFVNNYGLSFNVVNGSLLSIEHSYIFNNTGDLSKAIIEIGNSSLENKVNIIQSEFYFNGGYQSLIHTYQSDNVFHQIYIDELKVVDNRNIYDYYGDGNADLTIVNSFFQNSLH
eukprot:394055_1